jgi:hypothetical protein
MRQHRAPLGAIPLRAFGRKQVVDPNVTGTLTASLTRTLRPGAQASAIGRALRARRHVSTKPSSNRNSSRAATAT